MRVESGDIRYPHFSGDIETDCTRPFFLPHKKRPGPEANTAPTYISIVCSYNYIYSAGARARAHVNVHVHGRAYTHAVNVHVYVCAQLHNLFFTGLCPKRKK